MMAKQNEGLTARDLRHVWHPCSQMKDYERFPPLEIRGAAGPFLHLADGRRLIDAISSWWCKSLGHGEPRIRQAVNRQMDSFEHVIGANTCCEVLVSLSERLASLCPPLDKVFYACDGSTAVEIALKMCVQYHAQTGHPARKMFCSLRNGYHGETLLALAVSDCGLYSKPFEQLMPAVVKIGPPPYVAGPGGELWDHMPDLLWNRIEEELAPHADSIAAVILEPVLQGAGGMRVYSPDLLHRLRAWTATRGIPLVADEIMTGFGRTGRWLAVEHAGIVPDLIVLSKGLTAGWSPLSAVLATDDIYQAFYADYGEGRAFLHSNTYAGHSLGAAAALEAMKIYEEEDIARSVAARGPALRARMSSVAATTGCLRDVRGIGFAIAANLFDPDTGQPFPPSERIGFKCFMKAVELGALLRPLGDTIYFLPPLNTPDAVLDELAEVAGKAVEATVAARRKK